MPWPGLSSGSTTDAIAVAQSNLEFREAFDVELPLVAWNVAAPTEPDREALIRFWLAAPVDLLPGLWQSTPGESTKHLVRQLSSATSFSAEQVKLRDEIGAQLSQLGLQHPLAPQLLLATFLLSPAGLFQVAAPDQNLPQWLLPAYRELYEQSAPAQSSAPQPQASAPLPQASAPEPVEAFNLPEPDFGPFPASLQDLSQNRIHLNRMLGLANLYYIDPEDREIASELLALRRDLSKLIQACPEDQLAGLWASDLGERYWAVVRSGVQRELLEPLDEALKNEITRRLQPEQGGGFGTPGALNAFLVAMIYFEPGTMRVDAAESKLPSWLLPHYEQVFLKPLQAVEG